MPTDNSQRQSKRLGRALLSASVHRDKADLIERAADLTQESVSAFIGVAAVRRAEQVIRRADNVRKAA